jgi:hypothetical protein
MARKRKIEIFSAGCPVCEDTIASVKQAACPSCEVSVLDMKIPAAAKRARELGVMSLPAVAIDGTLADCCAGRGPDLATLKAAGLGRPLG